MNIHTIYLLQQQTCNHGTCTPNIDVNVYPLLGMHTFPGESEMRSAIKKGLTSEKAPESPPQPPPAEAEVCTKVQVLSSLTKFELKLFDKEPELVCM